MNKTIQFVILTLILVFGAGQSSAEETKSFMGKIPTPEELVEALSLPEDSNVRTRGIRLNLSQKEQMQEAVDEAKKTVSRKAPRVALDIKFEYDSDQLTPMAKRTLQSLAQALNSKELKGSKFLLEGHTDATGSESYNLKLSERRARAAESYLNSVCNVKNDRLVVKFYGETKPLVKNDPEASDNRRVEVVNVAE